MRLMLFNMSAKLLQKKCVLWQERRSERSGMHARKHRPKLAPLDSFVIN